MGSSIPTKISLPHLHYKIGEEPRYSKVAINQFANYDFINEVEVELGEEQYKRVKNSFLGPLLKFHSRKNLLSGKMMHIILSRSLKTKKKNELWFHFGSQPMRFSIREFHMVTGLKCEREESEDEEECDDEELNYDWNVSREEGHTAEELMMVLRQIDGDSHDERFCLAMLILIESILLQRHSKYRFPWKYIKKAQGVDLLLNYSWGREAYMLLVEEIKKAVPSHLTRKKYDIHGYPFAFVLWILESVPQLQSC